MSAPAAPPMSRPGWWDPAVRTWASLRAVNAVRLQLLRDWLGPGLGDRRAEPAGRTVVDLGCGGGLMSVPLARSGARVVGIDLGLPALREARAEAAGGGARFVCADLRGLPLRDGCADLVLLCDVLEHVDEPGGVFAASARLLRPGGFLFVNTINRTWQARLLAVTLGEGLGLIPRGTHDPARFVRPQELAAMASAAGLRAERWHGERPLLWRSLLTRTVAVRPSASLAVGYCAGFAKVAP